jgi:hypothetical protein
MLLVVNGSKHYSNAMAWNRIKSFKYRLIRLFFEIRASGLKIRFPAGTYIPPEVYGDEFSEWIFRIAQRPEVKTLIEIGSSSGEGSTSAIVKGLRGKSDWQLHLLEVDTLRREALKKKFSDYPNIFIHNYSSVSLGQYPSTKEVEHFYYSVPTNLNSTPIDKVLQWLKDDKQNLIDLGISETDGIESVKKQNKIQSFDFALIDGSEFSGFADYSAVVGAKYILLDDINGFKCYKAHQALRVNPDYTLEYENWQTRNGFAVFSRSDFPRQIDSD